MNQNAGNFGWYIKWNGQFRFGPTGIFGTMGAFHSTQKSGNFGWYTKWNGSFRFGPTGIVGTSFEGGLVWPVWSFRSVGPKCPFPFDKIVVYSAALLHPAYKNNNQTRGGLGGVCATGMHSSIGHVKFLKFQTGIFVEWKAPLFEGSPIWPVWSVWSVGPKLSLSIIGQNCCPQYRSFVSCFQEQ